MSTETTETESVTVTTQPPESEAKLAWMAGRVILGVGLVALTIWWRLRNGGELSEAIDEGLELFNTIAAGATIGGILAMLARTWKGSKPLTMSPSKVKPVPQPPVVTTTAETKTTTSTP